MKLRNFLIAPVLGAVVFSGALALAAQSADKKDRADTFRQLDLFGEVLSKIETEYVVDTDDAELIESAINGMLLSLDPHSSYLAPDGFRDLQVTNKGEYGGIGLEVVMDEGYILVVSPMDDTPGARAGIRSGDYLIAIDDETILGQSMDEALDKLRGPAGAAVTVTVAREGEDLFDVELVREIIEVRPVTWRVEDDDIAYLRVAAFNDRTTDTLEQAIRDVKAELGDRLAGVVVDVRNNPGGLLEQAVGVSDVFLDGGEVVSTRGRNPSQNERFNARPGDLLAGVPLAVLVNEGSASASEIVAGALQDRRRGTVVGMTSFGKGSVQTVIPLRGGRDGALRLTTARYYTPSGRSIQATGIVPDLEVSARPLDSARRRLAESDLPNALMNDEVASDIEAQEEHVIDEPPADFPEDGDFQLKRAIDVLRGVDVTQADTARAG